MTRVVKKNCWCFYSPLYPAAMLDGDENGGTAQTIVTSDGGGSTWVEKVDSPTTQSATDCTVVIEENGVCQIATSTRTNTPSSTKPSDPPSLVYSIKQKRVLEKFIYVTSVLTLAFLVHALLTAQWLLPYYYAISAPILLLIRLVLYWRLKWQYFLLDFCYTANTLWYIYLWAVPANAHLFCVVFSLANGPLLWAVVVYRNSLVFHSLDKVTSAYIHLLPTFLSFGVRWYSKTSSVYWYTAFIPTPMEPSFIWLVAIPLACFVVHSLIYGIVVNVILRPSDEFLTSYRYLTTREGSCFYKFFSFFRPSLRVYVYFLFNWVFCSVTVLVTYILYKYFIAHCIALAFVVLVCVFNGASFYMDVFSVRGFQDDD